MRIISSFKDYYDGLCPATREETPVYLRRTAEHDTIAGADPVFALATMMPRAPMNLDLRSVIVLFCGRAYPYWLRTIGRRPRAITDPGDILAALDQGTWFAPAGENRGDTMDAERRNQEMGRSLANDFARYLLPTRSSRSLRAVHPAFARLTPPGVDTVYAFCPAGIAAFLQRFHRFPVPLAVHTYFDSPVIALVRSETGGHRWTLAVNPCLRDLGFASVLGAPTTAQEIDVYLGNEMARQVDPVPERTDALIAHAHGFGMESFRNIPPGLKKLRRRQRKENA